MAVTHIGGGSVTSLSAAHMRKTLGALEAGLDGLGDMIATMQTMIDGDGSQASHFTYATARFGFASDAKSKEAWDELNSLYSKLSGNGSVSNVNAALRQAFAKFR